MTISVAYTAADVALPEPPRGYGSVVVQNPSDAVVDLLVHQGHGTESPPRGIALAAGDSILLKTTKPVFLNTVGNVPAEVVYEYLA